MLLEIKSQLIGSETHSVSARELHTFLEVGKNFANWIKNRIEKYNFIENEDYIINYIKKQNNNATLKEYHITLDMAKELCMVENNFKGREARRYFIQCEKQLKTQHNGKNINHILGGYKSHITKLEQELNTYKNMPVVANHFVKNSVNLEERIKHLLSETEEELKREKDNWNFFQHRANTFVEYIKFLQIGGTEAQQFMINSIVKSGERASNAEQKYNDLKFKFEEFEKSIDSMVQTATSIKESLQ